MVKISFVKLTNVVLLTSIALFSSSHANLSPAVSSDASKSGSSREVAAGDNSRVTKEVVGTQSATVTTRVKNSIVSLKTGLNVCNFFMNAVYAYRGLQHGGLHRLGFLGASIAFADSIYNSYRDCNSIDAHHVSQERITHLRPRV